MVDLGPFIDPDASLGPEWDNPLFYFNLAAFIVCILILLRLRSRKHESGLASSAWLATLILTVGTGLHFLGDLTAVSERWDHQFIHFVVLCAAIGFLVRLRRDP